MLDRLLGPADLSGRVVVVHLTLGLATDARDEATERDSLLVLKNVIEVLLGVTEGTTLEGIGGLASVLRQNCEREILVQIK